MAFALALPPLRSPPYGRQTEGRTSKTSKDKPYATKQLYLDYLPTYDQFRNVETVTNKTVFGAVDHEEIARFDYTFDDVGNRLSNEGHRGTVGTGFTEGFSKIQDVDEYGYDTLYRLTDIDYNVGDAVTEQYVYDNLGNRSTYTRDTASTAYAANGVNEYTSIGGVSVHYDANGNLSRDEDDFEYTYDHENRLIGVSYEGAGSTQVAAFEYDALGRMISSQLRFDTDADGQTETLKYYYDGQNAIAEYDPSDNLSRRYVHGGTYIDERAVLIEGESDEADTFYYLLQELYTVAGLIARNGTVVEANVYDGYGPVATWGYRRFDFDRNTVINMTDITRAQNGMNGSAVETGDPGSDADLDGDTDIDDLYAVYATYNQTGNIDVHVSSVGNPFHFTGRRLHYLDDLTQAGANDNRQVQYNRARHYDPGHGRWLQREPFGYVDGMNLYEYLRSNPLLWTDPTGWGPYKIGTAAPTPHPHPPMDTSDHGSQTADDNSIEWWRIANIASDWAWMRGWDDAGKHLEHYLENTGSEYTIDAKGLFTEDTNAKALFFAELNRAMAFVESTAPGHHANGFHIVSQTWDAGQTVRQTNWFYAVGAFRAYGGGPAEVLSCDEYKLDFTYRFDDPYDWHVGLSVTIMGVRITDDLMRHLHLTGLAKEFHMVGRYTKSVTWDKGQRYEVETGSLKDPGGRG